MKPGLTSHLAFSVAFDITLASVEATGARNRERALLTAYPLQKVKVCRFWGLVFVKHRYLSQFGAVLYYPGIEN